MDEPERAEELPATASQPAVTFRQPRGARMVWLGLITFALALIAWQTRNGSAPCYNLLIAGGDDCLGAEVVIDGKAAGRMAAAGGAGRSAAVLYCRLKNGPHDIAVTKPGFRRFASRFAFKREDYIRVELSPERS